MTCALERVRVTDLGCEGTGELESQPGRPKVGHGCKSVATSFRFTHSDTESLGRYAIFMLLCGYENNPSPGFLALLRANESIITEIYSPFHA